MERRATQDDGGGAVVLAQADRANAARGARDVRARTRVASLAESMRSGARTSVSIAQLYFARMDAIDRAGPAINAIIERNPQALAIADVLDRERRDKGPRGPLHGVPVVIKDNIDTADRMRTSAGSLALAEHVAARDAFVVERLRAAGCVILGKTNLSEWANIRSTRSTSGWAPAATRNPYALDRTTSGSSAGGRRDRGRPLRHRRRHRDRRLHHEPRRVLRARRDQTHRGAREPQRHRAHLAQPGHGGPDDAIRRRRKAPLWAR